MNYILSLIPHYGYILVYALLSVELLGIPFLPGELLIVYCGFLAFKGELNVVLLTLTSILGVCTGLTVSYFIGKKLGTPFFDKYGSKIHLGPDKMEKMSKLINKYGSVLIFFICFIPGLKHIIGYFSGTSSMNFKKYAIGGYLGSIFWSLTFVTVGYSLGNNWNQFHKYIIKYLIIGAIILVIAISIFYILKIYRKQIFNFIQQIILKLLDIFHSLGRIRLVVLGAAILCILLVDGFINIIQGLLSNDITPYNDITYYLIKKIFGNLDPSNIIFKFVNMLELNIVYIVITLILILYILYKSKHKANYKSIEIRYTLITLIGGLILQKVLLYIFNFANGYINIFSNLFDVSCFNAIIIYGFLFYIIIRSIKFKILSKILVVVFLVICILVGLVQIFYNATLSQVLAGYSLGGSWLTINIILLEITKILPKLKK